MSAVNTGKLLPESGQGQQSSPGGKAEAAGPPAPPAAWEGGVPAPVP